MTRVFRQALLLWSGAFLFALLSAAPCAASEEGREPAAEDLSAQELAAPPADIGVVTVTDGGDRSSPEAPGAFTSVILPSRYARRAKTVPELLSETVSVGVTSFGGDGSLSTVSIRGSSAEQVAVFVDGVRVNSSLTGIFDFSSIPTESIERIEVIRGASSARFGSDAIGGVINVVTRRAGAERAIEARVTGGSFLTLRTSESWREPGEGWDLVLAHNHRSTGGEFTFTDAGIAFDGGSVADPRTYRRLHNKSVSENVLAKVSFDLPRDTSISASNDFYWTDRDVPGMAIETTQLYPANPLEAHEEVVRNSTAVKFIADDLGVEGLSLEAGASNVVTRDRFTDPSPAIGDPIDVAWTMLSPGGHLLLAHEANAGPARLDSLMRYQYSYDHASDSSPLAGRPLMGSRSRSTNAVFAEIEAGFLERRIRIAPSARVEAATGRRSRASWRVSASGKPAGFLELKANAGTAFRYPTFAELYWPDQGYLRGNPELADERSFGWDAGAALSLPMTRIEAAFFQSYIDNQIVFVPVSAFTIQPVNTSGVKSQGVELSLSFEPHERISLFANYSWLDAKFKANGLRLPGRPSHKANARIEGRIRPLSVFGELKYTGDYPINMANTLRLSARTTLDLGATMDFTKHLYATFEVKDVTNAQTYDAVGFPLPRRSYWVTVGGRT